MKLPKPTLPSVAGAVALGLAWTLLLAVPVFADTADLNTVVNSLRTWLAGLLAALATLFLTIGGLRYLTAGGNPRAVEQGKDAIRSALIGYALAALAPLLVDILRRVVGI